MPSVTRLYTVDDVRAMPDDRNRYETIAGELFVTPAPSLHHQDILARLFVALRTYAELHALGHVWFAPLDVVFGPLTLVEPDILFVARGRRHVLAEREVTAAPDMVIEVLSPTTARTDRGRKRALYQEQGVGEYWIVDPDERRVEVWRPGALKAELRSDVIRWQPDPDVEPLAIDLEQVFKPL